MFIKITSDADIDSIYKIILKKLTKWSEKWQMLFNFLGSKKVPARRTWERRRTIYNGWYCM